MFGKPRCSVEQVIFWRKKRTLFFAHFSQNIEDQQKHLTKPCKNLQKVELNHVYNSAGLLEGNDGIMNCSCPQKSNNVHQPTHLTNRKTHSIQYCLTITRLVPTTFQASSLTWRGDRFCPKKGLVGAFFFGPFMAFLMA